MSISAETAKTTGNVAAEIAAHGLCIGCGMCAALCPASALKMSWQDGCLVAADAGGCVNCGLCLRVCPFADGNPDEDKIGEKLFSGAAGRSPEAGYFEKCFEGYSPSEREKAPAGGLASWFLASLLRDGTATRVISVRAHEGAPLFEYSVHESPEQVLRSKGSAYYPVQMAEVIRHIITHDGRYAIIGLPCFIKALRLASAQVPILKERVVVAAGLTCGHGSTAHYADYCARLAGLTGNVKNINFRKKIAGPKTNSTQIEVEAESGRAIVSHGAGMAWLGWWFVPNACLFCDDSLAECADVTFMDAWLPEYANEPGTNLVIARTKQAAAVLESAGKSGEIKLDPIGIARVVASQKQGLAVKRGGIELRMRLAREQGLRVPQKRNISWPKPSIINRIMLRQLYKMGSTGNISWRGNVSSFRRKMFFPTAICEFFRRTFG